MPDNAASSGPGLGDLLGLFGGNPLAGITRSVGQFQKGVDDFLASIERFNETMEQLNGVARRVNGLLDTVEEPIKAFVPQVTRTLRAADTLVEQLSAPVEKVAPGLARLAETLSAPAWANLPRDLAAFAEVLGDLARRMQPLGQLAETAGSLFGLPRLATPRSTPEPEQAKPSRSTAPAKKGTKKTAPRRG